MRLDSVALVVALVLLASATSGAQPVPSFHQLALRVNLDDQIQVEDQSGVKSTGHLTHLTHDDITILTDAGERRVTSADVRKVILRRRAFRTGVLIGAGIGAAVGALAACAGSDRSECADGPLMLGSLGAGIGWVAGALAVRATTVYQWPIDNALSRESAQPEGPFDDLALRVNLDDQIRVEDLSGKRTTGRLTNLTGHELTIETSGGERRFTSATVHRVALPTHPLGKGALIGAGAFALIAAVAPACRSNTNCVPLVAAPFGAGLGLAAAALVPRMTTVYRAQEAHVSFSPAFSRGSLGVLASLRW